MTSNMIYIGVRFWKVCIKSIWTQLGDGEGGKIWEKNMQEDSSFITYLGESYMNIW